MPCYVVCDGIYQEVTDDVFDAMVQALNTETPTSTPKAARQEEILTEVTTKNNWVKTISENIINKIYQHP
jgi:hypothetical protein